MRLLDFVEQHDGVRATADLLGELTTFFVADEARRRADEALDALERYLDSAFVAGLPFVRIIHGKGTGAMRKVVHEYLHEHPQIKSWRIGTIHEGGDGITVVEFR